MMLRRALVTNGVYWPALGYTGRACTVMSRFINAKSTGQGRYTWYSASSWIITLEALRYGTCTFCVNNNWCASGCVVECRICNREVAGSNLGLGYFAPRSTQPSIPPGSVNEYQLRMGRQRQVWLIPIADERVGVQIKLWYPSLENTCCEIP